METKSDPLSPDRLEALEKWTHVVLPLSSGPDIFYTILALCAAERERQKPTLPTAKDVREANAMSDPVCRHCGKPRGYHLWTSGCCFPLSKTKFEP
jgi:hypothetical protein